MEKPILVVKDIAKSYGKVKVLVDIDFTINKGEVFGLLGPNGAGKSTLTQILVGLMNPDMGSVEFEGLEVKHNKKEARKKIGVVPQEERFFRDFSVKENLSLFGALYGLHFSKLHERVNYLAKLLELEKFMDRRASKLSGGYRRLLNVACSLIHDPELILMDEPTVGLDPKMRRIFWDKIIELKESGKTVCLTTHYMDEAQQLCDRIALMVNGKILVSDSPKALIKNYGGKTVLVLTLEKAVDLKTIAAVKEAVPEYTVRSKGNQVRIGIVSKQPLSEIPKIVRVLIENGVTVVNSSVKQPTLEDVFLNLTKEEEGIGNVKNFEDSL
ncbi:MAG: ABC transporter ATP-binding protein [Candidatus Diapherotrites archaeon]